MTIWTVIDNFNNVHNKIQQQQKIQWQRQSWDLWHLRHWLQFWQMRTWIFVILRCFLTIFLILRYLQNERYFDDRSVLIFVVEQLSFLFGIWMIWFDFYFVFGWQISGNFCSWATILLPAAASSLSLIILTLIDNSLFDIFKRLLTAAFLSCQHFPYLKYQISKLCIYNLVTWLESFTKWIQYHLLPPEELVTLLCEPRLIQQHYFILFRHASVSRTYPCK